MKTLQLVTMLTAFALLACGNSVVQNQNCKGLETPKSVLSLSGVLNPDENLDSALGGFLVFDEINRANFIETGDLKGSLSAEHKCSASLTPRLRDGKYFILVGSSENCASPFVWRSLNQKILLSIPGTKPSYVQIELADYRPKAVLEIYNILSTAPLRVRKRATADISTSWHDTPMGYYADNVKGLDEQQTKDLFAKTCRDIGSQTPIPANCLWYQDIYFDEVEVKIPDSFEAEFSKLAIKSKNFENQSALTLNNVKSGLGQKVLNFKENTSLFQKKYDKYNAEAAAFPYINCPDAKKLDLCLGYDISSRKNLALKILSLLMPEKVKTYEEYFASSDLAAAGAKAEKSLDADFISAVKTIYGPALESYFDFRGEFEKHKELLSILSNHLDGTKYEKGHVNYVALFPFAAKTPEPLKGIKVTFDSGKILFDHPGSAVNQNLALDGHMGSVLAFGGIPVLPFTPAKIDQSDRTSTMPLPDPGNTQVPLRDQPKDGSGTKDTTNGKGLKSDRANCAL